MGRYFKGRKGFSLIELLVVIAIIGILATLVMTNLSRARSMSRDGRRKNDVASYKNAIESYRATNGSAFIKYKDPAGTVCTEPTMTPTTTTCVGAKGSSYGRINHKGTDDYAPAYTIAEALKYGGFVASAATDPFKTQDYVLVRCGVASGSPNKNNQVKLTTDESYAVWAKLENTPSLVEVENTARYCGGSLSGAVHDSPTYVFDFAATFMPQPTMSSNPSAPVTDDTFEVNSKYFSAGNTRLPVK